MDEKNASSKKCNNNKKVERFLWLNGDNNSRNGESEVRVCDNNTS